MVPQVKAIVISMLTIGSIMAVARCICFCFVNTQNMHHRGWLLTVPLFAHLGIAIWGAIVFSGDKFKRSVHSDPERFDSISVMI